MGKLHEAIKLINVPTWHIISEFSEMSTYYKKRSQSKNQESEGMRLSVVMSKIGRQWTVPSKLESDSQFIIQYLACQ